MSPFLQEMWRTAQGNAEELAEEWAGKDKQLKQEWRSALKERHRAERSLQEAKEELRRTRSRYEEKHEEPVPETLPSRGWYIFLLVVWFFAELPVNGYAFQLFGESLVFSVVGAALVALVLLPSAHYLGKLVRNTSSWTWKEKAFAGTLTSMPLAVIAAISWMRGAYAQYLREEGFSPGLRYLGDDTAFWVLAAINAALFVAATYLSYRKHPKWLWDLRQARAGLREARERYQDAGDRCAETATTRQHAFEETRARFQSLQETFRSLVERYRDCNLQARSSKRSRAGGQSKDQIQSSREEKPNLPPRGSDLALKTPEELEEIDWSVADGLSADDTLVPSDASVPGNASKPARANAHGSGGETDGPVEVTPK
ncbi:hypothetical protein [Salinibacter grassmerensis]|uniref:hypothetical protein n=1 Tax=Salinibacter grassmerensis TaxID=3040353 RepID=UPI0021E86619|nr:hypothetical protein [Salinibacter grassmerensis]